MQTMRLREWQTTIKPLDGLIMQASPKDGSDSWQPFPIGMGWKYAQCSSTALQIGTHELPALLAICTSTYIRRGNDAVNRKTIVAQLAPRYENREFGGDEYFAELPKYKFVISPEGNGVDCHRHYEALIAGCIPIMERNPLVEEKYRGCPILWTTDYSEITDAYLEQCYEDMIDAEYDFSCLFLATYSAEQQAYMKDCGDFWIRMYSRKLVFVSVFNRGAAELARNHLTSLNANGCTNYRAFCTDPIWTEDDDLERHIHLDANKLQSLMASPDTDDADPVAAPAASFVSGETAFGTSSFIDICYLRFYVLLAELRAGNDAWYLDVDTVVRANLNNFWAKQHPQTPFMFQDDINMPCNGCMFFAAGSESINMITDFLAFDERQRKYANDQIAMAAFLMKAPVYRARLQLLDRGLFACGRLIFGDEFVPLHGAEAALRTLYITGGILGHAAFVHANYMVGVDTKIRALKSRGMWYLPQTTPLPPSKTPLVRRNLVFT